MNKSKVEEIITGVDEIDNADNQKHLDDLSVNQFRSSLMKFLIDQTSDISDQNELACAIRAKLQDRLCDMTVSELITVYKTVSNSKTNNLNSILDPFKGNSQTSTPLLPAEESTDNEVDSFAKNMSSEELQVVQKLLLIAEQSKNMSRNVAVTDIDTKD